MECWGFWVEGCLSVSGSFCALPSPFTTREKENVGHHKSSSVLLPLFYNHSEEWVFLILLLPGQRQDPWPDGHPVCTACTWRGPDTCQGSLAVLLVSLTPSFITASCARAICFKTSLQWTAEVGESGRGQKCGFSLFATSQESITDDSRIFPALESEN